VLGTIGNAPRTICCGPGAFQTDIGILKNTNIGERYRVQFRGEILQLFNHAQFFQPDGNTTDGTDFGRVKRAPRSALGAVRSEAIFLGQARRQY
jgi:hypothetical protein